MTTQIRLERETSASGQAGCATAIGLLLTLVGVLVFILTRNPDPNPGSDESAWVVYAVSGGLALLGVLLFLAGIKMFLMQLTPEPIVEVDRMPVPAGQSFELTIRQPGPARLLSLRVNVVCEQTTTRRIMRQSTSHTDVDRRLVYQQNVVNLGPTTVGSHDPIVAHATVTIPVEVELADREGHKTLAWRLEVWGRVRGRADFMHPFAIHVIRD